MEFVSSGPKSYAFKCHDGFTNIKVKGISLKHGHRDIMNFEKMKAVILAQQDDNEALTIPVPQWGFVYKINEGLRKHLSLKDFKFNHKDMKGNLEKIGQPYIPKNFIAPFGFEK